MSSTQLELARKKGFWRRNAVPYLFLLPWFLGLFALTLVPMLAMSVISLVPSLVIFFSLQRYFVEGIATTGIKG